MDRSASKNEKAVLSLGFLAFIYREIHGVFVSMYDAWRDPDPFGIIARMQRPVNSGILAFIIAHRKQSFKGSYRHQSGIRSVELSGAELK